MLARLAAAGDDQAFNFLVRRHKESLYRLLRRYTGDADEAYEAVQEAFIAAWGALDRYEQMRAIQKEAQPVPSVVVPVNDAPVMPPQAPAAFTAPPVR